MLIMFLVSFACYELIFGEDSWFGGDVPYNLFRAFNTAWTVQFAAWLIRNIFQAFKTK